MDDYYHLVWVGETLRASNIFHRSRIYSESTTPPNCTRIWSKLAGSIFSLANLRCLGALPIVPNIRSLCGGISLCCRLASLFFSIIIERLEESQQLLVFMDIKREKIKSTRDKLCDCAISWQMVSDVVNGKLRWTYIHWRKNSQSAISRNR